MRRCLAAALVMSMGLAGCESLIYTAIHVIDPIEPSARPYLCADGREVSTLPTFPGLELTLEGRVVRLRQVNKVTADGVIVEVLYWLGDSIVWDDGDEEDGDARLYDLGPDGQPIDTDGVVCQRI